MNSDKPNWKEDWDDALDHFVKWWNHEGPLLRLFGPGPADPPLGNVQSPPPPTDARQRHTDPEWFAANERYTLSRDRYWADNLPIAFTDYGTVQLAACLGAEPGFAHETVWYSECIEDPDECPPLLLTKEEPWWKRHRRVMEAVLEASRGDYLVGMPAFGSNMDVLAALRGTQNTLCDMVDRPDWVKQKLEEINLSFFTAFDDYYEFIGQPDGSNTMCYYHIWGPGKISQVQCDFSAMISPHMFAEFVVPPLQRQCAWLDYSLYHLDGPDSICHLEHLLAIPELDAIQWSPGEGQPSPGDEKWFDLYERVLAAGKSLQVQFYKATSEEVHRILDIFGGKGVFVGANVHSGTEAKELIARVESMR